MGKIIAILKSVCYNSTENQIHKLTIRPPSLKHFFAGGKSVIFVLSLVKGSNRRKNLFRVFGVRTAFCPLKA